MKKMVKAAGVAALVLATGAMMSCGDKKPAASNGSAASSVRPEKTVTLQVYDQLANFSGEQLGWFAQVMLDKFNVKLNIIPESGNTFTTRMESGNLGDIVIFGSDADQYLDAVDNGLLYDWEEEDLLANHGSYIKDNMKMALEKNRGIAGDGHVYGFGHGVSTSSKDRQGFFYTWDLRYDLYEQLGKPEIKDYDDLHKVLKQMKEICPTDDNGNETYGVSLFPDWDGNMVMFVKSLATAYVGWDEFGHGLYDPTTGKYHPCTEKDGAYYQSLKFLNGLYQDGLLDPDSQTQTYDGMNENYVNGTAFWNVFNWMASGVYNTEAHNAAGKAMYPVRPTKASPICYGQSVYGGNRVWCIGAKTEYPELCMEIINWLSTPEGFMTSLYGPKDSTWYIKDGKTYFTELGKKCQSDQNTVMEAPYSGLYKDGTFQMNNITWANDATNPLTDGETYNKTSWASEATEPKFEIEAAWRKWADSVSVEDYLGKGAYTLAPSSDYSDPSKSDELAAIGNQCSTAIKTGSWRAMYANSDAEFEKLFNDMVSTVDSYGFAELTAFYNDCAAAKKAAEDRAAGK